MRFNLAGLDEGKVTELHLALVESDTALDDLFKDISAVEVRSLSGGYLCLRLIQIYRLRVMQLLAMKNIQRVASLSRHFDKLIDLLGKPHAFSGELMSLNILLGLKMQELTEGRQKKLLSQEPIRGILAYMRSAPKSYTFTELVRYLMLDSSNAGEMAKLNAVMTAMELHGLVNRRFDFDTSPTFELTHEGFYEAFMEEKRLVAG